MIIIIIIILVVVISENFIIYSMNYCHTVFCEETSRKKRDVCVFRFKTNSLHISKCLISSSADDAKETY